MSEVIAEIEPTSTGAAACLRFIARMIDFKKMTAPASTRLFDLNIEKILEGWEPRHAVRELISNALDEQALSATAPITIERKARQNWVIRDYGRGLRYEHLTQNENQEKLASPEKIIGRFGVGLKDALATFSRRGIRVTITSRFGIITIRTSAKHGFEDVETLHAVITEPTDREFQGTEVELQGIADEEVESAKDFFLVFSGEQQLEGTRLGEILSRKTGKAARIYVNGIVVAEEDNFAFSYNITSLTAAMRKALNRERTNVGRTAYSDRVKAMLLSSSTAAVANTLASELEKVQQGTNADEVAWQDVAVHACRILNTGGRILFVTATETMLYPDAVNRARADGCRVVCVPDNVRTMLHGVKDLAGGAVRDLNVFQNEWLESFEFKFVSERHLTWTERRVFRKSREIGRLVGGIPNNVREILVSETMRPDSLGGSDANGLWEPERGRIIIKRSQLSSLADFAGTLLHEIAHAASGHGDVSREFEGVLTEYLGAVAKAAV